jgi:heptosyltransferase III
VASLLGRIVVVRAGALGDCVLALPALRHLRAMAPAARIEVVGYPDVWEIAGGIADAIISIERPLFSSLYSSEPAAELREWLAGVDLVVAWTSQDPTTALRMASVERVIHVSPFPPPGTHAAVWMLRSLPGETGSTLSAAASCLQPSADEQALASARLASLGLEKPIFIHPGAGAAWKRWPADRFAALLGELVRHGHQVAIIAGPADDAVVAEVLSRSAHSLPVVREPSVRLLAVLLAAGRLFIGNDSGVSHLAAASGTTGLVLFGPTDPAGWQPLGDVRVMRACRKSASRQGQIRVCEDPDCMSAIALEDVLMEVDAILERKVQPPQKY